VAKEQNRSESNFHTI